MKANLDTEMLTMKATTGLLELDKTFIGTVDYMGMAYFWNWEYRHYLRPMTYAVKRRVHAALRAAGLDVSEASPAHEAVILKKIDRRSFRFTG